MGPFEIFQYYQDPAVRRQLAAYCGFLPGEHEAFSCTYIVGYGETLFDLGYHRPFASFPNENFHHLLDLGLDVFRSVMDEENTIFVFDVEYFNKDDPGLIYRDPYTCFRRMDPLYHLVREILGHFGIPHLTIMTGQGYHFACQLSNASRLFERLAIAPLPEGLWTRYQGGNSAGRVIDAGRALAFEGMGRLQEYLCHLIFHAWGDHSPGLYFSDIIPLDRGYGHEGISLDLTAFADPLFMRDVRLPFSTHQKGPGILYCLPRGDLDLETMLALRVDPGEAAAFAHEVDCRLPYAHEGLEALLDSYFGSDLAAIHRDWDSVEHDSSDRWHETYLNFDRQTLPPCLRESLDFPEPLLLQPTYLQNLTRVLMGRDWHPRHIGGLVRALYATHPDLCDTWGLYDPSSRANFWIRIYAAFSLAGLDDESDLTCAAFQARGLCPQPWCGTDLCQSGSLAE